MTANKYSVLVPLAAAIITAIGFAPLASADPTLGHFTNVVVQSPELLCTIGADDTEPGVGPNVVCQNESFPQSPVDPDYGFHADQAVVTAAGEFTYRVANIPTGGDDFAPDTLAHGEVYHLRGWTIIPTVDSVSFTNDATNHGMIVTAEKDVQPF